MPIPVLGVQWNFNCSMLYGRNQGTSTATTEEDAARESATLNIVFGVLALVLACATLVVAVLQLAQIQWKKVKHREDRPQIPVQIALLPMRFVFHLRQLQVPEADSVI